MNLKEIKEEKGGWMKAQGNKWDPKKGDYIYGIYLRKEIAKVKVNAGKYEERTRYILKTEDGLETKVFGTTILDDLFSSVPEGNEVYIEFTGTSANKPPLSPTKLFDVYHRQPQKQEEQSKEAADNRAKTLNSHDYEEVQVFIQGVEEELKDKNLPLIEVNMLKEAHSQTGDDRNFFELARRAIVERKYPVRV